MEKEPLAKKNTKEKRKGMSEEGKLKVISEKKRSLAGLANTKFM